MSNLFNIDDPGEYRCHLHNFGISHEILNIKITDKTVVGQTFFYVQFEGTIYFQGPTQWRGAGFQIASPEKHRMVFDLLSERSIVEEMQTLYSVQDAKPEVLIVASTASLLNSEFRMISHHIGIKD